jgi:preprotein translocase subunit SecD
MSKRQTTFVRNQLTTPTAILLLISACIACSMLRRRSPLTWGVTLEIDAPLTDREAAMKQTIAVLESRLDALGISGFDVKPQGDPASGRILLSLPGSVDRERLKRVITAGGKLELTHVISPPSPTSVQTYLTKEEAVASLKSAGAVPTNRRVLAYNERSEPGSETQKPAKWVVVESPAIVGGKDLRTANAMRGRGGTGDDYEIVFTLNAGGAEKFGAWTGANTNEYLGVVLNDEVKSIAFIRGQIFDQGEISGRFTKQAAEDLALVLKSGSLPYPVRVVSESFIEIK